MKYKQYDEIRDNCESFKQTIEKKRKKKTIGIEPSTVRLELQQTAQWTGNSDRCKPKIKIYFKYKSWLKLLKTSAGVYKTLCPEQFAPNSK